MNQTGLWRACCRSLSRLVTAGGMLASPLSAPAPVQRNVDERVGTWKRIPEIFLGPRWSLRSRAEWRPLERLGRLCQAFDDAGGTRTGVDQTLRGFPFTPGYLLGARLSPLNSRFRRADGKFVVRGDLRAWTCRTETSFSRAPILSGNGSSLLPST